MALLPNINVGTSPNDGTGDSLRTAFTTVNENFQFIEAFFPNSSVSNLVANITSTGTSVFNIANVDVLNVNTISSFTVTDATISNNLSVTGLGTFGNLTVDDTLTGNIISTGTSTFNITSYSGLATFSDNVVVDNTLTSNIINADNIDVNININTANLISSTITTESIVTENLRTSGNLIVFGLAEGFTLINGNLRTNALFFTNTVTVSTDVNLATPSYNRAQTIIANLTAGNLTVTVPNASANLSTGLTYTFICYDEGGLGNRTLTVNVQPGAANIWTSANTQATFVNLSAELGTNSVGLKTNEIYWFTY